MIVIDGISHDCDREVIELVHSLKEQYSEAVELLERATKQCICNQLLFDIRDLLKRHKEEV